VVSLQRARQLRVDAKHARTVFFDRSPVCSLALARFLGFASSTCRPRRWLSGFGVRRELGAIAS
jgi:predicted ATPase